MNNIQELVHALRSISAEAAFGEATRIQLAKRLDKLAADIEEQNAEELEYMGRQVEKMSMLTFLKGMTRVDAR